MNADLPEPIRLAFEARAQRMSGSLSEKARGDYRLNMTRTFRLVCPNAIASFAVILLLAGGVLPSAAQVSLNDPSLQRKEIPFEPRALQLLQQMAGAYSRLPALDQQTEFRSTLETLKPATGENTNPVEKAAEKADPPAIASEKGPVPTRDSDGKEKLLDMSLHLAFQQPNRLLLEMKNGGASSLSASNRFVSDGKTFWSYVAAKQWYTQEKAPGNIHEFARLDNLGSGCLELMMLMGINPFADLKDSVDSIRYEGGELIRGMETEVVVIEAKQPAEQVVLRLYIGKGDLLLRRLAVDRTSIVVDAGVKTVKVGDALDELNEDLNPPPAQPTQTDPPDGAVPPDMPMAGSGEPTPTKPVGPIKARLVYDNIISTDSHILPSTFVFTPPPGAQRYQPAGTAAKRSPRSNGLLNMVKKSKIHKIKAPRDVNP